MFCRNCGNEIDPNAAICVKCGFQKGTGSNYCHNCGKEIASGAAVCMNCGFAVPANTAIGQTERIPEGEPKSKLTAGLLAIFLGAIGVHSFYLGNTQKGIIHLALAIGGIFCFILPTIGSGIWGLIEGIMILCGNTKKDARGIPLK